MNLYQRELDRIRKICYSNEGQIRMVIGTRKFIDHNFDRELNLDLLSDVRFTSKFHLLRLFKKYYGLTPKQYLIAKRIEKSKEYLKNGMSVTKTCFAVGFESPCSFSTLFKSRTGHAPAEFQKRNFRKVN
jgi:AraC-like DNA-binding protein